MGGRGESVSRARHPRGTRILQCRRLIWVVSLPNLPLPKKSKMAAKHFAKKVWAFARQKYACSAGYGTGGFVRFRCQWELWTHFHWVHTCKDILQTFSYILFTALFWCTNTPADRKLLAINNSPDWVGYKSGSNRVSNFKLAEQVAPWDWFEII